MTIPGKTWKDQNRKRQGRKVRTQMSNRRFNERAEERVLGQEKRRRSDGHT